MTKNEVHHNDGKELKEDFVQYSSTEGKNILYNPSRPVKNIKDPEIQKIIQEMKERVKGKGIGLAANQIGKPYQIFLIEYTDTEDTTKRYPWLNFESVPLQVFINPKITAVSKEKVSFWHGCLSAKDKPRGLVATYRWIEYDAFDENGKHKTGRLDGLGAVIFQHEFRHLLGSLYFDYAKSFVNPEELVRLFESGTLKPYEIADDDVPLLLSDYKIGLPIVSAVPTTPNMKDLQD